VCFSAEKKAVAVLSLQAKALAALSSTPQTADQIAAPIRIAQSAESTYLTLEHLSSTGRAKTTHGADPGPTTFTRA
jgi:hypothetical protein